jgi:hypothetical protein
LLIDNKFFGNLQGPPITSDSALDDLFGDFADTKPSNNISEHDSTQVKIQEKREAMELISFKITMVFLEKILIVFKDNKLSEGK